MKKRILKLCQKEAIRYTTEHSLTADYIPTVFNRLVDNYYNKSRKERGRFRLALMQVNGIKPIRGVYAN